MKLWLSAIAVLTGAILPATCWAAVDRLVGTCDRAPHPTASVELLIDRDAGTGTINGKAISALQMDDNQLGTRIQFDATDFSGTILRHFDGQFVDTTGVLKATYHQAPDKDASCTLTLAN